MKLTVIGYWGAYPEKNSASSAYLLEQESFRLLIDCGSGALAQLQQHISVEELDAVILSHYHHDHIADVGCLQYALFIAQQLGQWKGPLTIYGHREDAARFNQLTYRDITVGHAIGEGERMAIGPFQVSFCTTNHTAHCLAVKVSHQGRELVYTADTYWTERLVDFAREADLLLCECTVYKEEHARASGHLCPALAGRLAREAQVKELILTHLPHYGSHQELLDEARRHYPGRIRLAEGGLQIEI